MKNKIKFLLAVMFTAMCCFAAVANATELSGICGENLTWTFDEDSKKLTISGTGDMYDYEYQYVHKNELARTGCTEVIIGDGVTSVGEYAFVNCDTLEKITLPNSVTTIGDSAFSNCAGLTEIAIPSGVTSIGEHLFYNCAGLTEIVIPNGVTSIGEYAFCGCAGLSEIVIPSSVTTVGEWAFSDCDSLTEIVIQNGVTTIGEYAFYDCDGFTEIVIPNSVTTIGDCAFSYCDNLTEIVISNGVTTIGKYAFSDCNDLTEITLPPSIESIGEYAFYCVYDVRNVYITDLSAWCGIDFEDYTSNPLYGGNHLYLDGELVTELIIPEDVTSIESYAFFEAADIEKITIPKTVKHIGRKVFHGTGYYDNAENWGYETDDYPETRDKFLYIDDCLIAVDIELCLPESLGGTTISQNYEFGFKDGVRIIAGSAFESTDMKTVIIPESVESIGEYAFYGCAELTEITLPSKITIIPDGVFYDSGLRKITIPDGVTTIGNYAFCECTYLSKITIPDSVTTIGKCAFGYCWDLIEITIPDSVTTIGEYAFSKCHYLRKITIPDGVTTIGKYAFNDCWDLTEITIPDSVTFIGEYVFSQCADLTEVTILGDVTEIGESAFSECDSLTEITILGDVTKIGKSAFSGCDSLTEITISGDVTEVGEAAFYGCDSLEKIFIPKSVKNIGNNAFGYCVFKVLYYGGSEEEWAMLSGETGISEETEIICNYKNDAQELMTYVTDDETCFYVAPIGVDEGTTVILALYNQNAFVDMLSATYEGKTLKFTSDKYYDNVKVMAWSDLTDIEPVCDAAKISLTDGLPKGKCGDGVYWRYDPKTEVLTIKGTGDMYDYGIGEDKEPAPWKEYHCAKIVIEEGVTSIGDYAFYGMEMSDEETEKLILPKSIKRVGEGAFVTEVRYNDGNTIYDIWRSSVDKVYITDLAAWCNIEFEGYDSSPLAYSFEKAPTELYLNGTLVTEITIPENVTKIGDFAFCGCYTLEKANISDSVTTIGEGAFACTGLREINIPSSVEKIGIGAFSGCENLTKANIPDGIEVIESATFDSCYALSEINIPDSVKIIGEGAFYSTGLTEAYIPSNVKTIGAGAFCYCPDLSRVNIADGVENIGESVFYGCEKLETVIIPKSVKSIGNEAFYETENVVLYYCGSEEEWNNIILGEDVGYGSVVYDYTEEEC